MKKLLLTMILLSSPYSFAEEEGEYKIGHWLITKDVNKLTGNIDYSAIVFSVNKESGLVLRCYDNKTDAYLATNDYFNVGDYTSITSKIDGQKQSVERWQLGSEYNAAFPMKPIQFIRGLYNKNKFFIGYTPRGRTQKIEEFNLDDINEVAQDISRYCNWKL